MDPSLFSCVFQSVKKPGLEGALCEVGGGVSVGGGLRDEWVFCQEFMRCCCELGFGLQTSMQLKMPVEGDLSGALWWITDGCGSVCFPQELWPFPRFHPPAQKAPADHS